MSGSKSDHPVRFLFANLWKYSAGNRHMVVAYWLMFIVSVSVIVVIRPLFRAKLIGIIQKSGVNDQSWPELQMILLLLLVLQVVFWIFHGPARVIETVNAFKVRTNYRRRMLKGVMTLPLGWHTEHHSGDTIDKIEKGASSLHDFSKWSFQIIYSSIQFFGSYIAMSVCFGFQIGMIATAMFAIAAWIIANFDTVLLPRYERLSKSENQVSEIVFDRISNITTVIILRVERVVFDTIMKVVEEPEEFFKNTACLEELKWFLTEICCRIMQIGALALYLYRCKGVFAVLHDVAPLFLLWQYLDSIGDTFFNFAAMYGEILKQKARVKGSEDMAKDFREESFANHVLPADWKEISIEELSFSYQSGRDSLTLDNVSAFIRRGEHIACVGKSGGGKSTFFKLLHGLHPPSSLKLSVDGKPIPEGFNGCRNAISLMPQDPEIFATTMMKNITLDVDYDKRSVRKFAKMACFTEVAYSLPKGFDTAINEKGVDLSGGQKQRLALARGLIASRDKQILLFDEPTSSIDQSTELEIYKNIFREFADKTIISSIHRLHLLPYFDRIFVFDKGRLVACGTLDELLATCPEFVSLWESGKITAEV